MKNTSLTRRVAITSFSLAIVASFATLSFAQADSHSMMAKKSAGKMMAKAEMEIGLEGYCPVCVIKHNKWVKGDAKHSATFDGVTYYFPSDEVKNIFQQNPAAYVPALGGDCTVCYAKAGKRMPGNIRFAAVNDGRLYLFPSEKEREVFHANPQQYTNVDLAESGMCIVCKVKAGKSVNGDAKFTAIYDGFRYQFPSARERTAFEAQPAAFVAAAGELRAKADSMKSEKMMKSTSMIQIQGKTACAACEFGVTPINAPEELGLAVTTQDGRVFVIEDGHSRWPQIYKGRFEGQSVAVSGSVIKTEGRITWINPSDVKTL